MISRRGFSRSKRIETVLKLLRNPMAGTGLIIISVFFAIAIFAPTISPYDPEEQDLSKALLAPSWKHPFGNDEFGRDVFSRIIYGARPTVIIAVTATAVGLLIGGSIGVVSGYFGGIFDAIIMRFLDVLLAFPGILLALALISGIGPGVRGVIIATSIYSIPQLARVARAAVLEVKTNDYVVAAKATGEKPIDIVIRYIIPNAITPVLVLTFLRMAVIILIAASLSFLGVGIQPPTPEWGIMLSSGRSYIRLAPHLSIFPGVAIILVILGFNLIGDGIRDALDPRTKG